MFNLKRSAVALSSVFTVGLVAAVAMSTTAPGAAALRLATSQLSVSAKAAGGGGGFGVDNIAIASPAELVAKLAVNVTVSFVCQPVFDPTTGSLDVVMSSQAFVQVQEKTGKTVASGENAGFGTAVCDEFLVPTPTVNTMTILVSPDSFSGSGPFKNGTGLGTVNVIACPISFNASGFPPPCDSGLAQGLIFSIK